VTVPAAAGGGAPALLAASRCRSCGLVAVPLERYGCERCGALPVDHDRVDLRATGRVVSIAEVHRHHQPEPPTPFVVAAVEVDGGPVLKGVVLDGAAAGPLHAGERVEGCFVGDGAFRWARTS
jgi:uncharacterized OB-fold protein